MEDEWKRDGMGYLFFSFFTVVVVEVEMVSVTVDTKSYAGILL